MCDRASPCGIFIPVHIYSSACLLHKFLLQQISSLPLGAAFGAVKIAVSPVTAVHTQHCVHKRCFIRHYRHDEMKMKSNISWRQFLSFRYTLIKNTSATFWFRNVAVLMFIQRSQSLLKNLFVAVLILWRLATNKSMYGKHWIKLVYIYIYIYIYVYVVSKLAR